MLSAEDLLDMLLLGHEQRGIEFKAAGPPSDKHFFAIVARAAMAMANRRDGGRVIIGVCDTDPAHGRKELTAADALAWMKHDVISEGFARFAQPPLSFHADMVTLPDGIVVVVDVAEFEDYPVICVRQYDQGHKAVLQRGAVYVRSAHKPESVPIPSPTEMRELIELATEKGLRRFLETTRKAGAALLPNPPTPTDEELFAEQIGSL